MNASDSTRQRKGMAHYKHLMTAPNIESSTREERLDYVLNEWRCLHNCEPMEQREQKPNLFGLCRNIVQMRAESNLLGYAECSRYSTKLIVTEEGEAKYAANVMS